MFLIYFSFVVNVLMALKHPSDEKKTQIAREELEKRRSKWYKTKNDFVPPIEWLNPEGHESCDIKSIDCLVHHGDLLKGTNVCPDSSKRMEFIETCLFRKGITQWEGKVSDIRSDGQGTIKFKQHFLVRFGNVRPQKLKKDEKVNFCLSFDMFGLSAWRVMRVLETKYDDNHFSSRDDDSSSEYSEPEDMQDEHYRASPSLSSFGISQPYGKQSRNGCESQQPQDEEFIEKHCKWDKYNKQPTQERISVTNPINRVFFEGNIAKDILLDDKIGTFTERTRGADVCLLKVNFITAQYK